jgi:hypothetical protein
MKNHEEEANRLFEVLQHKENTRSIYLSRINNHAARGHFLN